MGKVNIDIERAVQVGKKLLEAYHNEGIFEHKTENMPELLKPEDLTIGSYEHVNYITLLVALDYMREANQLWRSGIETFNDKEVRWVFDVNSEKINNINLLINGLQKHKVSKKYNRDAKIWQKIALSIKEHFNGSMKSFIENECNSDAKSIFDKIRSVYKNSFPNLKGNKILPLWIRMMRDVCELNIQNINSILLPVDVHVARATIFTGCIYGAKINTNIQNIRLLVDEVWKEAAKQSGEFNKLDVDEPLWTLSKYGCKKLKDMECPSIDKCPVKQFCIALKKNIKVVQGDNGVVIE
jgi:hypothetical protein